ncbi:hypothetical protein [Methylocystis sp.]|uniref:hypothetical protein n=1 Tax=Methylocystis sp. TaxID=1911079 RepID=UPI003DA1E963
MLTQDELVAKAREILLLADGADDKVDGLLHLHDKDHPDKDFSPKLAKALDEYIAKQPKNSQEASLARYIKDFLEVELDPREQTVMKWDECLAEEAFKKMPAIRNGDVNAALAQCILTPTPEDLAPPAITKASTTKPTGKSTLPPKK